jgi:biopolymer transport protein ExbD
LAKWDVFHSDRLEVQRGLSSAEVRQALASGDLRDDDLIRPAGSSVPWGSLLDSPALSESEHEIAPPAAAKPEPPRPPVPKPEAPRAEAAKPQAPQAPQPEIAKPQTPKPEVAKPQAAKPEAAKPQAARPEVAKPQVLKPEVAKPPLAKPESSATKPPAAAPGAAAAAEILHSEFPPVDASVEFRAASLLSDEDPARAATTEDLGVERFGRGMTEDLRLNALFEEPARRKETPLEAILDADDHTIKEAPLEAIIDEDEEDPADFSLDPRKAGNPRTRVTLPLEPVETEQESLVAEVVDDEIDDLDEDEAVAEFTLTRGATEKVEELDLAAMVDVAFQLVLFFLVTATTIMYKTLEVPKPAADAPPGAVSQGQGKSLEDLANDYILVEIDPQGAVKVDHEPAPGDMAGLAERFRSARAQTGRAKMLLSADALTMHRAAVAAYDAANEIGLGIAIARPTNSGALPPAEAK